MNLILATNNQHKVEEIQAVVGNRFKLITLQEAGIDITIPEPYLTLEENALNKSSTIFNITQTNCFSEDTGLEVDALNGEPGVKSARYAGEVQSSEKNIEKLLYNLSPHQNRKARFRTVVSLIYSNKEYFFEGICEGYIEINPRGNKGFGYDSVFTPLGASKTFAEMTLEEKNIYSHRRKAIFKLIEFLQSSESNID